MSSQPLSTDLGEGYGTASGSGAVVSILNRIFAGPYKLVVAGIGLLMISQNYSFFLAFWDLWTQVGADSRVVCKDLSFWLGFDAFICFFETVMVSGMMLGAVLNDRKKVVWWLFFVLHLAGGLTYTVAVVGLGMSRYNDDGKACAAAEVGFGDRSAAVFTTQAAFYLFYCLNMASLFYQVVINGEKIGKAATQSSDSSIFAGIGLLMISQNYSFFLTYWDLWSQTSTASVCSDTSFWLSFDSFICWFETVMVCGMMLGAWIEDPKKVLWWTFFSLHLIGGLTYTVNVIGLGAARYSSDGKACAGNGSVGDRTAAVYITQAVLYVPYCVCMASLFYLKILKTSLTDEQSKSEV